MTQGSLEIGDAGPPAEALDAIRAARRIALIGHVTPDADCLGSMGALWLALPELGKQPRAALPAGSVSRTLAWLVSHGAMSAASTSELAECDLAIVLDTAREKRVNVEGKLEALPRAAVVNVDHHESNSRFGRWTWIDGRRSSTSEMTYELIRGLGCQITPTIATMLYAGIHSDTQGFSLPNSTPGALRVAHELAAAGARIPELCERLFRSHSRAEFDLLRTIYRNTRVSADGRLAWSSAALAEIAATGCDASTIDNQVEVPRSIEGIRVAILFTEAEPGKVRMNFRGESGTSVLELAQQFNGGGHRASAGARLEGPLGEVMERVLAAAARYVGALG